MCNILLFLKTRGTPKTYTIVEMYVGILLIKKRKKDGKKQAKTNLKNGYLSEGRKYGRRDRDGCLTSINTF